LKFEDEQKMEIDQLLSLLPTADGDAFGFENVDNQWAWTWGSGDSLDVSPTTGSSISVC